MKFEEVAEKAFKKQELLPTANLAEKYAYSELYYLYRDFNKGNISEEEARKKKSKIEKEFDDNQRRIDDYYEVFRERNEIRKKYHEFLAAIERSTKEAEILDNSLKFIESIVHDNSFYNRQMKKIDNQKNI